MKSANTRHRLGYPNVAAWARRNSGQQKRDKIEILGAESLRFAETPPYDVENLKIAAHRRKTAISHHSRPINVAVKPEEAPQCS